MRQDTFFERKRATEPAKRMENNYMDSSFKSNDSIRKSVNKLDKRMSVLIMSKD